MQRNRTHCLVLQGKQRDGLAHFPALVEPTQPVCSKTQDVLEQTATTRSALHTPSDT